MDANKLSMLCVDAGGVKISLPAEMVDAYNWSDSDPTLQGSSTLASDDTQSVWALSHRLCVSECNGCCC